MHVMMSADNVGRQVLHVQSLRHASNAALGMHAMLFMISEHHDHLASWLLSTAVCHCLQ